MARSKRSHKYEGALAEPLPRWVRLVREYTPKSAPAESPEWIALQWDDLIAKAREADNINSRRFFTEYFAKFKMLYDHFGIDRASPCADLDLALELAWRHERDLFINDDVHFSTLYKKYRVDPDSPYAFCRLIAKLAQTYVPGFREVEPNKTGRTSLDDDDYASLVLAAMVVSTMIENRTGKKPSCRQLAEILQTPQKLRTYINPTFARHIAGIIEQSGNMRRTQPGPMSDTTIRKYLRAAETATQVKGPKELNSYHRQYLLRVSPRIREIARVLRAAGNIEELCAEVGDGMNA